MSIPGIRSGGVPAAYTPEPRAHERAAGAGAPESGPAQARANAAGAQAHMPSAGVLPTDAPPDTDPALWSVLSPAERAYYARARAQGPLTYTPGAVPASAPAARGGRLDVRA